MPPALYSETERLRRIYRVLVMLYQENRSQAEIAAEMGISPATINRMIRENGWVVNDYQKSIGGRSVYVVVAQSQNGGRVQSRMFYFTEADGRIYSVATNSATDSAERIAEESEKVIFSLQSGPRPVQQAAVRED